ncbi:MAG: peptidyl-dipeptidase Dcp, partial [Flavobacteriales bacterium]
MAKIKSIYIMKVFSTIFLSSSMLVLLLSVQTLHAQNKTVKMTNPLLQKSALQYQAPAFNLIKDKHFKPAFEYGLLTHDKEIMAIANNPAKPTFQNTVLAFET